jgi:putative transposase
MKKKSKNVKLAFQLREEEKRKVKEILNKGKASARIFKRARVLELFDEGLTSPTIALYVGVTAETARRIGWNYVNEGLDRALYEAPRSGVEKKISQKEETRIVALVCSDPPEGYDRWSVRLLTEEVKRRKIVDSIGRETIRVILKSHGIKPWREKNVVRGSAR